MLVIDRIAWGPRIRAIVTGRVEDPNERDTSYGLSNLALHVGDDPTTVRGNRSRSLSLLSSDGSSAAQAEGEPPTLVALHADHGTTARIVADVVGHEPLITEASAYYDAVVTARTDVVLLAMAADCVPLVLVDPEAGVTGVAHAGWRGTAAGILPSAVEAMTEAGADPSALHLHLGPAACGACYEVGDEVVDALAAMPAAGGHRAAQHPWLRREGAKATVDLRARLRAQAVGLGVEPGHITVTDRCTIEDPDLFSHRRDGSRGPTGRHGVLVRMAPQ